MSTTRIVFQGTGGNVVDLSHSNPLPMADLQLEIGRGSVANHVLINKFGKNPDVDAAEDIWAGGGDYTGQPVSDVETMEIFSSDVNDTLEGTGAQTAKIINLLDGSGNEMPDVTVDLDGTTPVSLGAQEYGRATRIQVTTAGSGMENAGILTLRHTTTTANIFAKLPIGLNQTEVAAYTVPLGKTLFITRFGFELTRTAAAAGSASVSFRARETGETYQTKLSPELSTSSPFVLEGVYMVFPALTDLKARCDAVSTASSIISASFHAILVTD